MPVVVRRVRELLVAGTTLSIAAAAHLVAGGSLPGAPLGWLVVAALTAPLAVWTSRRRLTLRRLLPAMVALQLVQHTALSFMAATDPGRSPSPVGQAGQAGQAGHALHELGPGGLSALPSAPTGLPHLHHGDGAGTSAWMLAAHAAAVLVTALLLAAGDRAATNVVEHLRGVAVLVQGPPPLPAVRRGGDVVSGRVWRPHPGHGPGRPRPRGPPLLPGALARTA